MTSVPETNNRISYRGDWSPSHNGLTGSYKEGQGCKKTNDDDKGVEYF